MLKNAASNSLKLLFLLIGLSFTACQTTTPEPITVNTVEQNYEVIPWQSLSTDGSEFQIILKSLKAETCVNAYVDVTSNFQTPDLSVNLNGNDIDGVCVNGVSFPQETIELPQIEDELNIIISQENYENSTGTFHIEANNMIVAFSEMATNIFTDKTQISKIQGRYFWGYVYGTDADELSEVEENLTTMMINTSPVFPTPDPGYYGHFELASNGFLRIDGMPIGASAFIFGEDTVTPSARWNALNSMLKDLEMKFSTIQYRFTNFDGAVIDNI